MKYLFGVDLIRTNNVDIAAGISGFYEFVGRSYYFVEAENIKNAFDIAKEKIKIILEKNKI